MLLALADVLTLQMSWHRLILLEQAFKRREMSHKEVEKLVGCWLHVPCSPPNTTKHRWSALLCHLQRHGLTCSRTHYINYLCQPVPKAINFQFPMHSGTHYIKYLVIPPFKLQAANWFLPMCSWTHPNLTCPSSLKLKLLIPSETHCISHSRPRN